MTNPINLQAVAESAKPCQRAPAHLHELPLELILECLAALPLAELGNCALVCKSWYDWTRLLASDCTLKGKDDFALKVGELLAPGKEELPLPYSDNEVPLVWSFGTHSFCLTAGEKIEQIHAIGIHIVHVNLSERSIRTTVLPNLQHTFEYQESDRTAIWCDTAVRENILLIRHPEKLSLWDIENRCLLATVPYEFYGGASEPAALQAVPFSFVPPHYFFYSSWSKGIIQWDLSQKCTTGRFKHHGKAVLQMEAKAGILAVLDDTYRLQIWDYECGELLFSHDFAAGSDAYFEWTEPKLNILKSFNGYLVRLFHSQGETYTYNVNLETKTVMLNPHQCHSGFGEGHEVLELNRTKMTLLNIERAKARLVLFNRVKKRMSSFATDMEVGFCLIAQASGGMAALLSADQTKITLWNFQSQKKICTLTTEGIPLTGFVLLPEAAAIIGIGETRKLFVWQF